jgi:nucleoside-diphosphate-sugar epimerase
VYSSSCSVYGAASPDDVLTEQASFNPVTPYAKSKVMVEAELASLADDDFSPTYMRNATVYGVSPKLRGDLVVNNLAGWAFTTGKVHLKSDGTPWRPLVHVEDVCHAFVSVLSAPRESIHDEPSTWAATKRTTESVRSQRSFRPRSQGAS